VDVRPTAAQIQMEAERVATRAFDELAAFAEGNYEEREGALARHSAVWPPEKGSRE